MFGLSPVKTFVRRVAIGICCTLLLLNLSACAGRHPLIGQTLNEGYIFDPDALDFISVGSSREQVLLTLGSPSLKSIYDNEVFYYISQTRYRPAHFMDAKIKKRTVLAIYFNKDDQVSSIAQYGLKNGQVFDFISRATPVASSDSNFIQEIVKGTKFVPAL